MANVKHRKSDDSQMIKYIFAVLICIPVLIGPFMRGLYFEKEFLGISLYIAIIFSIFMLFQKTLKITFFDRLMDWAIFGIFVAYLISTFNAAYIRDALLEVAKVGTYFLIYLVVSRVSTNNERIKNTILNIIFATGVLVALTGISTQLGIIEFTGAYHSDRIFTSIQYPNSAAAYLSAIFILGLFMLENSKKNKYASLLYSSGNFLLLYTIIGTQSRGGWLILPIIILAFILLYNGPKNIVITKIMLVFTLGAVAYLFVGISTGITAVLIILSCIIALNSILYLFQKNNDLVYNRLLTTRNLIIFIILFLAIISFTLFIYISHDFSEINLLQNSEFTKGKLVHWNLNGAGGQKREVIEKDGRYWLNISKKAEPSKSWGIKQIVNEFKPKTSYTLSFDAFSEIPQGQMSIVVHQIGPDGINPQLKNVLNVTEKKRYHYTFATSDLKQKEKLRIYLLLPSEAKSQNIYLSRVQLEEGKKATEYEKTTFKNQQILKLINRLSSIDLNQRSVQERFYFYQDALKISKDYPLFGLGGGGWANSYFKYQTFSYYTRTVHNHFLQVLVEAGILGFVFWCGIWFLLGLGYYMSRNKMANNLKSSVFLSGLLLGLHSIIDFTFSLGAISVLLFILLGLMYEEELIYKIKHNKLISLSLVVIIVVVVLTLSVWFSMGASEKIEWQLENEKPINLDEVKKYVKVDILNSNYYAILAEVNYQKFIADGDNEQFEKAILNINKAIRLDKYDYRWYMWKAKYLAAINDLQGAEKFSQKAIDLAPMQVIPYENQAQLFFEFYTNLKQENNPAYKSYARKIDEIVARTNDVIENVPEQALKMWHGVRPDKSKKIDEIVRKLGG